MSISDYVDTEAMVHFHHTRLVEQLECELHSAADKYSEELSEWESRGGSIMGDDKPKSLVRAEHHMRRMIERLDRMSRDTGVPSSVIGGYLDGEFI